MAVTFTGYTSYTDDLLGANIDLTNDTIKVALVESAYTFSASHEFFDDITDEIVGTGYTAGGKTITEPTITAGVFDAADVEWDGAIFTTAGAVIYKDTGTPATSPLIGFLDFGGNQTPATQPFKIIWDATGIISVSLV